MTSHVIARSGISTRVHPKRPAPDRQVLSLASFALFFAVQSLANQQVETAQYLGCILYFTVSHSSAGRELIVVKGMAGEDWDGLSGNQNLKPGTMLSIGNRTPAFRETRK